MGNFVFGDIQEIVCNHPAVPGGVIRFSAKSNETGNFDKGGLRTNDDANQVTSDGQMMTQINRVRWMVETPIAVDTISDAEQKALNIMSGSPIPGTWQFSLASGAIYKGTGRPVGDLAMDSNAGTLQLKVAGGRVLEKI